MGRLACSLGVITLLLGGCARLERLSQPQTTTPCEEVHPQCTSERLPNVTLTGDQTRRPLQSVDGFSLDGLITFDEALKRGIEEGGLYKADTVQVTLGSADATELRWGQGPRLFYAIDWEGGLCGLSSGPSPHSPEPPSCVPISAGTIIDAQRGEFIVSGETSE